MTYHSFPYTVLYRETGESYCTVLFCYVVMAFSKPTETQYKSLTFAEKVAVIQEVEKRQKIILKC